MPITQESKDKFIELYEVSFNDITPERIRMGEDAANFAKKVKKLGYLQLPGMQVLSFSKREKLHECARKFQLNEASGGGDFSPNVHTAFGHAVGAGIQEFLRSGNEARAHVAAFAAFDYYDIYEWTPKMDKSLWLAHSAIEKFIKYFWPGMEQDWELAVFPNGRSGIELEYVILINEKFAFQGHIDIVLRNKHTGELAIFEIKTTSRRPIEADWANSEQTVGYSAALDSIAKKYLGEHNVQSSYIVHYLVYSTTDQQFNYFRFSKSVSTKLDFVSGLMIETDMIEKYREYNLYPKNGSACTNFGRNCTYFGLCDLDTYKEGYGYKHTSAIEPRRLEEIEFIVSLEDILNALEGKLEDALNSGPTTVIPEWED